jgi:hypothetical protein
MGKDIVLGQHPLLKKEFVDKRIRELIGHNFVADALFTQTDVDALAIKYMKDADSDADGRKAYDDVPEVGEGSNFHRIGLDEEERSAMIRKYGLETVITYEMQKFGSAGQFERAYRKLALNVKKMVDTMAYSVLTNKAQGIQNAVGGDWSAVDSAETIIANLVDAKKGIRKFGYAGDTAVISPDVEATFMKNKSIRDALRQNNTDLALLRGYVGDFMGLSFIVDENFTANDVVVLQKKVIGDIADAEALKTKTYNEESNDRTIARATRFTQAYLTDPKAVYLIENVIA